jgi:glutamate formiminotransferase / formiminotetrahydrofolate cyclodeaminase
MGQIVECVPNFSEGKDKSIVDKIARHAKETKGVTLLDVQMDADHNRSVITFAGEPEASAHAAFLMCKEAANLIDMNTHSGEHPRLGATDVIPFVPVSEISVEECNKLSEKLANRIWDELKIPSYLYEETARTPERVDLAIIRRGEYEKIKAEMGVIPERDPCVGEPKMHPTAGCVVIGCRMPLVAFNVNLNTKDVSIAKKIAGMIRSRSGGFTYCKAMGFTIEERGYTQVSMNLTNYKRTSIRKVFEMIKSEALRLGALPIGTEIVGLLPLDAILNVAKGHLNLWDFDKKQILDLRVSAGGDDSWLPTSFVKQVSKKVAAPGGGSVSAGIGALASALASMVAKLSQSKRFASVKEEMAEIAEKGDAIADELVLLVEEDTDAFNGFMVAMKLPDGDEQAKAFKEKNMQDATIYATEVPLKTMQATASALPLIRAVAERGNQNSLSDAGVAALSVVTALKGAHLNILINVGGIEDKAKAEELKTTSNKIIETAVPEAEAIYEMIREKLS